MSKLEVERREIVDEIQLAKEKLSSAVNIREASNASKQLAVLTNEHKDLLKRIKGQKGETNIGYLGWLSLLFIGLKLGGVIHWSWWWVMSPFWIPLSVAVVILILYLILYLLIKSWQNLHTR